MEVNEIFQDLAVLVNEQGQMIDDIEANIEHGGRTKDAQRDHEGGQIAESGEEQDDLRRPSPVALGSPCSSFN